MQKLADVSTGLAVLDVDTRWTSRAEGGGGVVVIIWSDVLAVILFD